MQYTAQYGKGYSGARGNRAWVAAIEGKDQKFEFRRTFVESAKVEREHFNRDRTMVTLTWELPVGLYEVSEAGDRRFIFVQSDRFFTVPPKRAEKIAAMLDDGVSANEARKATREVTA